jgi:hypothetical protein
MREDADLVGLLAAADQFDVQELKAICGEALAARVTRANYAELLHLADLYKVKPLKAAALKYITNNIGSL